MSVNCIVIVKLKRLPGKQKHSSLNDFYSEYKYIEMKRSNEASCFVRPSS